MRATLLNSVINTLSFGNFVAVASASSDMSFLLAKLLNH
jgi:hypothetical protein